MNRTRTAGFLLPIPADAALDADQDPETDQGATAAGDGGQDGATGRTADDASGTTADTDGTDPDTAGEGEDEEDDKVRNPKIKALSEEAKRWRLRCRELETELASRPPDSSSTVSALRIEKEFYQHAAQRVTDLGAAFKLADLLDVTVDADGTVAGIDKVVNTVIRNYPFLSDEPSTEPSRRTTAVPDGPTEGGSPSNRRRGQPTTSTSALAKKFPALNRQR